MTPPLPRFQYTGQIFWIVITLLGSIVIFLLRDHIFPQTQVKVPAQKSDVDVVAQPVPLAGLSVVEVQTEPVGVKVFIDDKEVGITPLAIADLTFGSHVLSLKKSCYRTLNHDFILDEEKQTIVLSLEHICGDLEVTSTPLGADVIVNDKKRGVTPYLMKGVRVGELDLRVSLGHANLSQDVQIRAGHTTKEVFDFTRPSDPEHRQVWQDNITGIEFVWVKGGCFPMGNHESDKLLQERAEREKHKVSSFFKSVFDVVTDSGEEEEVRGFDIDEGPVHEVCLGGLWVGQKEVTNAQYMQFSEDTGVKPEWLREENEYNVETGENEYYKTLGGVSLSAAMNPVVGVSWHNVIAFSQWFSGETGYSARLLSEAEWEYVCRSGGHDEEFAGGDDLDAVAWYTDNSDNESHPVGSLQANGLGVFDFSGNVWEWTLDYYHPEAYASHEQFNPVQKVSGGKQRKVVRGGSWRSKQRSLRCVARYGLPPGDTNVFLGFRIVMPQGEKK